MSYEDGIWLIALTNACQEKKICVNIHQQNQKQSLFQQKNHDKALHFYRIINNRIQILFPLLYRHQTKIFILFMSWGVQ